MILQHRIDLLVQLGKYMDENGTDWQQAKEKASVANPWFVPEFIEQASTTISEQYLQKQSLEAWARHYKIPDENSRPVVVGLVMAGNIPMVGFHDMLSIFISGHKQVIKLSGKDEVLIKHLVNQMAEWDPSVVNFVSFAETLKNCDAYIATGSNNSSRYFDYYFGKFPNIIRRNRTSIAIINGYENEVDLERLADDIQMYFGLGCRNVTKLYVPEQYNFEPLLKALNKYDHFGDFHKYRHNYDYQLALLMMGNVYYMTNGTILLVKDPTFFTAVSRVNYEEYTNKQQLLIELKQHSDVQCIVESNTVPFGKAQQPTLFDYADGVDTMKFLTSF